MAVRALIELLLLASCTGPQDPKDPTEVLRSLEEDLRKAVKTGGKDKDVRDKLTKLAKTTFDRAIGTSSPKGAKSIWEYHSEFLEHIALADTHFRAEPDKAERTIWIASCKTVFSRQATTSKESGLADAVCPTVEDVYYDLKQAVSKVEKKFGRDAGEYDKAGYDAAKQAFASVIARARAPGGDPKSLYTKWLVEIDQVYPLTSDEQKKLNTQKNQLLKTAAKTALDRALAAPK
jgi:hypothetical protein